MARQPRLWIAIADGEHARLVARGDDNALRTTARLDSPDAHKQTSDLVSDRSGRVHESASPTRHGVAPRHDPHEQAQLGFARHAAAWIAEEEPHYDQLLLVAPPDILAVLQQRLPEAAGRRVVGTLMKDLVKVPDHALQPHLAEWVQEVVRR